MRYIVVTGHPTSSIGKGIVSSSVGALLQNCGLCVTCIKIDGYLNQDASLISPLEHGEVAILADGSECDLDLVGYEHFLNLRLTGDHNLTSGKILRRVLDNERSQCYLGKTVQMVPHVTDAIIEHIERTSQLPVDDSHLLSKVDRIPDVCIVELGGTVGDFETLVFLEALKRLRCKVGRNNFCLIHVALMVSTMKEIKTKPVQTGVRLLAQLLGEPDLLMCRSSQGLNAEIVEKLSISCLLPKDRIISVHDAPNIYCVPGILEDQDVSSLILKTLHMDDCECNMVDWSNTAHKFQNVLQIALVGKYTDVSDSYLSVNRALQHAATSLKCEVNIVHVDCEQDLKIDHFDGIIVPGGFGNRGQAGIMAAIGIARRQKIPFLGICLGLQLAVLEFARNVMKVENADSTEFNLETKQPFITLLSSQKLRLGAHPCHTVQGTLCAKVYKEAIFHERFRHRYEVNPEMTFDLESGGMVIGATDPSGDHVEAIELADHPFFLAVQSHPEFQSRRCRPSPPFVEFCKAALEVSLG